MNEPIQIRECSTVDELTECVRLQREVFALPEIEISPVRHLIVTKNAGGWTLGAFAGNWLVGFVLSVPAFLRGEKAYYSHMTAISKDFQGSGIGARLKWAQRERALAENVKFIKWTFEPVKALNAFFNLEKLGAIVTEYQPNFYGTDYSTSHEQSGKIGLDSDRLFAEWHLESEKAQALASGGEYKDDREPAQAIEIPVDWLSLVRESVEKAVVEQTRVRNEFQTAFAAGLKCEGFLRDDTSPKYLLYR